MSLESVFKLSVIMNMVDKLSGPMVSAASNVGNATSLMEENLTQACGSVAITGIAMIASGEAITSAVLSPVEATFDTRRALGELSSLGVEDLDTLEHAARSFSDQWAGTTKADFISAAYDIKSGIASLSDEGVADFTALAGLTSKATKSSIGEMTSLFATGYGIYKGYYSDLSDLEFGEMFSAGISQSVKQFKTTGSGMAQSIQALGASATTANVPLEEQLSILGMLQATMSGSEAGTKYKAFLRSATKGGEALGLKFIDANNQLLSMPEILDLLRGKFGETMDAAEKMELQKAFGDTEAVALIDLMYSKTGELQTNILGMYDALGSGTGVATEMANAMNQTEPERYELLTQKVHNLKESIGNSLLPTVNDFLGVAAGVLEKGVAWIENHQELVKVIMLVALGLGSFLTVAGSVITVIAGIGLVVPKVIAGFNMMKSGFLLVNGALSPLIASVWSFTSALLANPITWIVIAIIGLIAGLVLLYNKCEWFRNLVNGIIASLKEKLSAAFAFIVGIWDTAVGFFLTVWDNIKGVFVAVTSWFGGVFSAAWNAIKSVFSGVGEFFGGVWDTIVGLFGSIGAAVGDAISGAVKGAINDVLSGAITIINGFIGAINTAISVINAIPGVNIGKLNKLEVPQLAEGGYVGANSPQAVIIGDNKHEGEIVSPVSKMQNVMMDTLSRFATNYKTAMLGETSNISKVATSREPSTITNEPPKKIRWRSSDDEDGGQGKTESSSDGSGNGRAVIIQKLLMRVDAKDIRELKQLIKLFSEVEEYVNGNGGDVDEDLDAETVWD